MELGQFSSSKIACFSSFEMSGGGDGEQSEDRGVSIEVLALLEISGDIVGW